MIQESTQSSMMLTLKFTTYQMRYDTHGTKREYMSS